jgi:hypothetical protein
MGGRVLDLTVALFERGAGCRLSSLSFGRYSGLCGVLYKRGISFSPDETAGPHTAGYPTSYSSPLSKHERHQPSLSFSPSRRYPVALKIDVGGCRPPLFCKFNTFKNSTLSRKILTVPNPFVITDRRH